MKSIRKVEVFSAGCPACQDVIDLINKVACPSCEITVLDMHDSKVAARAKVLGIRSIPAVVIDLLYDRYSDEKKSGTLKRFVDWALTDGQSYVNELGYVSLPPDLVERSRAAAAAVQ